MRFGSLQESTAKTFPPTDPSEQHGKSTGIGWSGNGQRQLVRSAAHYKGRSKYWMCRLWSACPVN
jgi:hypothetical protein